MVLLKHALFFPYCSLGICAPFSDVDECSASSPVCDSNAICSNTRGSYICTCKPGYTGGGKTCQGTFENVRLTQRVRDVFLYTNQQHFSLLHTHRSFKFAASVVIGILHAWRRHCLNHFKNDQIWSILQQKTKPIVFEFDPLFLILMVTCLAAHTVYATIIWCHGGDVSENK